MSASQTTSSKARQMLLIGGALVFVVTAMFAAYSSGFGKPTPHNIHIAVVGPPQAAAKLDASPALRVTRVDSAQQASTLIRDRKVYGAFDLSQKGRLGLYTANGGGHSIEATLTTIGTKVAQQGKLKVAPHELAPTDASDPNGTIEFYCIVFLAVGAALGSSLLSRVHGAVNRPAQAAERVGLLVVYAAFAAGAFVLCGDVLFGALTNHAGWLFLTLWGYTAAVAVAATGVAELFGPISGVVLTLAFTLFGNTSAGGATGRPLLNPFFSALHPVFPHGGGLSIVRGVQYFGGRGISSGIVCLSIWAAAGVVLLAVAALLQMRRDRVAEPETEARPAPVSTTPATA